jgi:hypothetical protein
LKNCGELKVNQRVLKINGSVITLAEGNWASKISWTRTIDISTSAVQSTLNYFNSRYSD